MVDGQGVSSREDRAALGQAGRHKQRKSQGGELSAPIVSLRARAPPSLTRCLFLSADKAVSMEQGLCYRSAAGGVCTLPLPHRITQQICCCSRVGKGWGDSCQECPAPGSGEMGLLRLCSGYTGVGVCLDTDTCRAQS